MQRASPILPAIPDTAASVGATGDAAVALRDVETSVDLPAAEKLAARDAGSTERRRALTVADHNDALRRLADERVFESRRLPDATRDAIRRINDKFAVDMREYIQAPQDSARADGPTHVRDAGGTTGRAELEQIRRAALDHLLGPDEARVFEVAEQLAARALAPRYRRAGSGPLPE
jgi:hypothetical protein